MFIRAAPLVFLRLAHDRRFVGAFLFVFFVLLVIFVFFRISGRHRVAHDHEGTPVYQPGGKFFGDVWGHCCSLAQVESTLAYLLLFHLRH